MWAIYCYPGGLKLPGVNAVMRFTAYRIAKESKTTKNQEARMSETVAGTLIDVLAVFLPHGRFFGRMELFGAPDAQRGLKNEGIGSSRRCPGERGR
jgi:hypothetical protein